MFDDAVNTFLTVAYIFMYPGNAAICRQDKRSSPNFPSDINPWTQDVN